MVMRPQSVKDMSNPDEEPSNTVPMYSSSNAANQGRRNDAIKRRIAKNDTQNADIVDQRKQSIY